MLVRTLLTAMEIAVKVYRPSLSLCIFIKVFKHTENLKGFYGEQPYNYHLEFTIDFIILVLPCIYPYIHHSFCPSMYLILLIYLKVKYKHLCSVS